MHIYNVANSLFSHFPRPRKHRVVACLRSTLSVRYVSRTARHIRAHTHAENTEETPSSNHDNIRVDQSTFTFRVCGDCGWMLRAETADLSCHRITVPSVRVWGLHPAGKIYITCRRSKLFALMIFSFDMFFRRILHDVFVTIVSPARRVHRGVRISSRALPYVCDMPRPVEFWACEMSPATPARWSRGRPFVRLLSHLLFFTPLFFLSLSLPSLPPLALSSPLLLPLFVSRSHGIPLTSTFLFSSFCLFSFFFAVCLSIL